MTTELLQKLYLDNNGLTDEQLSLVIHGLIKQTTFKVLIIQNNQVGKQSLEEIIELVKRKPPSVLDELHLINTKSSWQMMEKLAKDIRRNYLQRLSLIQAGLNDHAVVALASIVKSSKSLISLDLSWNKLTLREIMPMLEVLSTNRRLKNLNLSWNNLSDNQTIQDKEVFEKDQLSAIRLIGKLIKHNRAIQHIDLTSTGLTRLQIEEIGNSMRKARALLSIHLSGNQDVIYKSETKEWLVDRIKCRPNEDI